MQRIQYDPQRLCKPTCFHVGARRSERTRAKNAPARSPSDTAAMRWLSRLRAEGLVAAIGLLLWSGGAVAELGASGPVPIGERLPNVTMTGLNGPDRELGSYRGRKLIINVWASWCGPCRAEAASLERFAWSEAGSKYTVVGVSTDDYRSAAERWLKQSNATLSHYIDRALVLENMLGASHIPLTVLVDEKGRVVARVQGAREWDSAAQRNFIDQAYGNSGRARAQ